MIFQNKGNRLFSWRKKEEIEEIEDFHPDMEYKEEYVELEKNDFLAMCIAAVLVFGPIFLVLIGILIWSFNY